MSDMVPNRIVASVDHDLCVGHASCRRIAPTAFRRTSVGQSEFVDNHRESDAALGDAAENCPVAAIRIRLLDRGEPVYP